MVKSIRHWNQWRFGSAVGSGNGDSIPVSAKRPCGRIDRKWQSPCDRTACSGGQLMNAVNQSMKHSLTPENRIVITGMGVLCPCGHDIETFSKNLRAGNTGFNSTIICSRTNRSGLAWSTIMTPRSTLPPTNNRRWIALRRWVTSLPSKPSMTQDS